MNNNIQAIVEQVTGINKQEQDEIFKEVKENQSLLNSCVIHSFSICLNRYTKEPINNPSLAEHFGAKWKCSRCGGIVDFINKSWYEKGLKHHHDINTGENIHFPLIGV